MQGRGIAIVNELVSLSFGIKVFVKYKAVNFTISLMLKQK